MLEGDSQDPNGSHSRQYRMLFDMAYTREMNWLA